MNDSKKIAIIGLGYVGLPLAVEFGKKFMTLGFDINLKRIKELKKILTQKNMFSEFYIKNKNEAIFELR